MSEPKDIPGINIRAFRKNDAEIVCRLNIMFSDAMNLATRENKELEEWFLSKLVSKFQEVINERRSISNN